MERLLSIRALRVWFPVRMGLIAGLAGQEARWVRAVDGIGFNVNRGEVFCLVGESGCGKTTTGKAILRLNDPTAGNIFLDIPDEEWERVESVHRQLEELWPVVAKWTREDRRKAKADWREIRRLRKQLLWLRNPKGIAAQEHRRERLDRGIQFLEDRTHALRKGEDSAIRRLVSRDRARLEYLRSLGPWFTPARAHRLERLEKEWKEAKFQLQRAQVTHMRTNKPARAARRFERRVSRTKSHMSAGDPRNASRISELQRAFEAKEKRLTALELSNVQAELGQLQARRNAMVPLERKQTDAEIRTMEATIAQMREQGGQGLRFHELQAEMEELRERYDIATWGIKRKSKLGRRRGRRKERRRRMRELRRRMQIIYQDPYESLNPKLSIFDIVSEPLLANKLVSTPSEAEAVVAKALEDVGLRPADEYMFRYPHELSGGQRQRVGIATALVVDPDFIVADEPVSMLDASVRTEILALLLDLKQRRNLTYLFITHDLGLAWILADRIAVMYLGKIVEAGNGAEIIQNPRHPYTKALISVVPSPNPSVRREKTILRGERPNPVDIPSGCRFHPRCPMAVGICGWDSEEVRQELQKLFQEDRANYPEAESVATVTAESPIALTVTTPDPAGVEKYLRKRIQAVALGRPALGAIRTMAANAGALALTLHQPVEPPLRIIKGDVSVACHLVEPEIAEPEPVVVAK